MAQNDALGSLLNKPGLGLSSLEGLISSGDSGGPAFIGNLVAGIASFTANLSDEGKVPDIDSTSDSSFGEIAAWQRISAFQQWIDQSLRMKYANQPSSQAAVQKAVIEGAGGTTPVYFWVQLSVDYKTRNGTALAGHDFIATEGTLNIYPNEDHALVMVEIVADTMAEPDETFYLDVFNPVGASFGPGMVQLTAVRTILNDDGLYWG